MGKRYDGQHQFKKLYASAEWQKLRRIILNRYPLCVRCKRKGRITASNTVNHVTPHRGDLALFRDQKNLEAVCASCHSGEVQQQEARGYANTRGDDGWPVDPAHPFNNPRGLKKSGA